MADHYTFLSWIRDGAAAEIGIDEKSAEEMLDDDGPVRAPLTVRLDVETLPAGHIDPVPVHLAVHGPGDVASLDPDEILRVDPPPGTTGFEPNRLPFVEFRRADLPWLFSPRAGTPANRHKLRPWLTLVVVAEEAASLLPGNPGSLPRLRCPLRELPEPDESWAWAHAQARDLETDEPLHDLVANPDGRALSRLLACRRLEPGRRYVAAVVPSFRAGAEAALGSDVTTTTTTLAPAWPSPRDADGGTSVELPLYHHWRFATGEAGDFESLVRRLKPHASPEGSAARRLDVGDPGAGVIVREPGAAPETLPFSGALVPGGHVEARWGTPAGTRFAAELRARFDAAAGARTTLVGPPLYGGHHAGLARLPAEDEGPHWLRELNTDPRLRAYAGLGVETVARRQEALMASAWDQLDDIEAVNAERNRAALAQAVGTATLRRRIGRLRRATLLQMTRGAHVVAAFGDGSVRAALATSDAPTGLVDAALRRIAGPRGPLVRRSVNRVGALDAHAVVERAVSGTIRIETSPEAGSSSSLRLILGDALSALADSGDPGAHAVLLRLWNALNKPKPWDQILVKQRQTFRFGGFDAWMEDAPRAVPGSGKRFAVLLDTLGRIEDDGFRPRDRSARAAAKGAGRFSPLARAAGPRRRRSGERPEGHARTRADRRRAARAARRHRPRVRRRTIRRRRLRHAARRGADLSPADGRHAARGAAGVRARRDRAGAARQRRAGADQPRLRARLPDRSEPRHGRGAALARLPDRAPRHALPTVLGPLGARGGVRRSPGETEAPFDIPPLEALPPGLRLLGEGDGAASGLLVLRVRGELLRRHPDVSIRLCPAATEGARRVPVTVRTKAPLFSARPGDDVLLLAFDLTLAEARGDDGGDGWFFVFREPPSGLRFGLDVAAANGAEVPSSLDDLAWPHVLDAASGARHLSVRHGRLAEGTTFDERVALDTRADDTAVSWGANGAHMARALMQWPTSIAFHADALLPAGRTGAGPNRGATR